MLDCRRVLAELSNYLDGDVPLDVKQALEQHLAKCHRCSLVYDTTRKTLKVVSEVEPLEVPLEASARLRARLRELFGGELEA